MNNSFAILILSCDKYEDLWPTTLSQFRKHFSGTSYKMYFASNEIKCNDPSIIPILSGKDKDWSSSYLEILKQIPEENLFVLLEDLIVASTIDQKHFEICTQFLTNDEVHHIKYWSYLKSDDSSDKYAFQHYDRGVPYRATVCGFWKRKSLQTLLIPGESPWNFEILGSYRTSYMDGFYGLKTPLFNFINLVEKGYWIPSAVKKISSLQEGISIELSKRPMLNYKQNIKSNLQRLYFNTMLKIPWRYRVAAMALLRKLLISY